MSFFTRAVSPACIVPIATLLLSASYASGQDFSLFDLEWDGPETSTVEECYGGDHFCFTFPIVGTLGVGAKSDEPFLLNVQSDILLPPQVPGSPPAISPNLWFNFDLLEGEYLSSTDAEVSMVFRPAEVGGVLRAYEIFVTISDDGRYLELTGGIEQDAASPLEPDVRFSVHGRLVPSDSGGLVDGADFLELQRGYAATPAVHEGGEPSTTGADFQQWQAAFGQMRNSAAQASIAAVPEPRTMSLAALLAASALAARFPRR